MSLFLRVYSCRCQATSQLANARIGNVIKRAREALDTYGHLFPDDEDFGCGAIEGLITQDQTELQQNQAQ